MYVIVSARIQPPTLLVFFFTAVRNVPTPEKANELFRQTGQGVEGRLAGLLQGIVNTHAEVDASAVSAALQRANDSNRQTLDRVDPNGSIFRRNGQAFRGGGKSMTSHHFAARTLHKLVERRHLYVSGLVSRCVRSPADVRVRRSLQDLVVSCTPPPELVSKCSTDSNLTLKLHPALPHHRLRVGHGRLSHHHRPRRPRECQNPRRQEQRHCSGVVDAAGRRGRRRPRR